MSAKEFNIGDYVRTKDGHIDKIVKISDEMKSGRTIKVQIGETDNIGGYEDFVDWFSPGHFIKSSPNIIDLIEVGDYVNGHLVTKITKDGFIWLEAYANDGTLHYVDFINEWGDNIKSIVTKEQFEAMKYEIK